ncbi:MAG TPA: pepsin/retropepsin-like aspartic protease family protein [Candidatus Krumholzibacteria bacterium]|nr:pepsin/retropepsin-like aspartic protease family protein [Candidatus Krumholzibacteria bacterium]
MRTILMIALTVMSALVLPIRTLAEPPAQPAIIPFTFVHGLIFVDVELPGRGPVLALLDTGANASAVDPRIAGDLGVVGESEVVGTTGSIRAENVRVADLRLGALRVPVLCATRRDLSGLLAPDGRRVEMILGSDAFTGTRVTIDFAAARLEIPAGPAQAGAEGVPMTLDNGIPAIEATLGGVDVWLRIDTGASLFDTPDVYVNIPVRVWEALRARHTELAPTTHFQGTGADGQTVELPVVPVPDSTIGALRLDSVFVIVQPEAGYFAGPDAKGFVSNNYLRRLGRVTLDYASGRLR